MKGGKNFLQNNMYNVLCIFWSHNLHYQIANEDQNIKLELDFKNSNCSDSGILFNII